MKADMHKVGLVLASVIGGWHLVWSVLVLTGVGQVLYNFILWAHMIHLAITIGPFDPAASVTLILITTIFGYIAGCIAAAIWNRVHRDQHRASPIEQPANRLTLDPQLDGG